MGFHGEWQRHWVRRSAALALAWLAFPSAAHAAAVVDTSVCPVTVTIQLNSPATVVPSSPLATVAYSINVSGTCTGVNTTSLSVFAQGWTTVAPTCAEIVSFNGFGMATWVGAYTVEVDFAGPTAAPTLFILGQPAIALFTAVGPLVINTASLQACLQPAGATTLQYTGVLVATI